MLITCDGCNAKIRVPDKAAGKRVKCPKCANMIKVPAADPAAADDPETSGMSSTPLPPPPAPEPETPDEQGTEITSTPSSKESKPPPIKKSSSKAAWDDEDDVEDEDDDDDDDRRKRRRKRDDDDEDEEDDDLDVRKRRVRKVRKPVNGMATTAMSMGIVSVTCLIAPICCCGLLGCGILATITGTLALIFGFMGKVPGSEAQAMTGIICGAIAVVLGLIELIIGFVVIGAHFGVWF
jgi:predicted Zn finger-like uncharacterized protein